MPPAALTRRAAFGGLLSAAATPAFAAAPVVTLLGDSIAAGFGLPAGAGLPSQLQADLARLGVAARVRNAGVPGDTAARAAARVDRDVRADTAVCVVAVGGNDLLSGAPPAQVGRDLDRIVARLRARRIGVALAGLRAPPLIGEPYARAFDAIYPALARRYAVPFLPSLLEGVALNRALNQGDGIHPNAAGVRRISARLAPVVAEALRRRGAPR